MSEMNDTAVQGEQTEVVQGDAVQSDAQSVSTETATTGEDAKATTPATVTTPYDGSFKVLQSSVMEQETITVKTAAGVPIGDITLQFPGTAQGAKIMDKLSVDQSTYWEALLGGLVVAPMTLRSQKLAFFDTHEGLFEVVDAADKFLGKMLNRVSE